MHWAEEDRHLKIGRVRSGLFQIVSQRRRVQTVVVEDRHPALALDGERRLVGAYNKVHFLAALGAHLLIKCPALCVKQISNELSRFLLGVVLRRVFERQIALLKLVCVVVKPDAVDVKRRHTSLLLWLHTQREDPWPTLEPWT